VTDTERFYDVGKAFGYVEKTRGFTERLLG